MNRVTRRPRQILQPGTRNTDQIGARIGGKAEFDQARAEGELARVLRLEVTPLQQHRYDAMDRAVGEPGQGGNLGNGARLIGDSVEDFQPTHQRLATRSALFFVLAQVGSHRDPFYNLRPFLTTGGQT